MLRPHAPSHTYRLGILAASVLVLGLAYSTQIWGEGYGAITDPYVLVERIGEGLVTDLDFSPDGRLVAASGQGLGVYDSSTGERIVYLSEPWTHQVAWSPGGGLIAVTCGNSSHGGSTGLVKLLESRLLTLRVVHELEEPSMPSSISWSPKGDLLASTGSSGGRDNRSISIWNVSTGRIQHRLEWDDERAARIVEWSPDGSVIASLLEAEAVDGMETLWIWDLTTLSIQAERDFGTSVSDLEWSPDGSLLAMSFSEGESTTIFDPLTMLPITVIQSDEQDECVFAEDTAISMSLSPNNIAWSREGSLLAGAFADGVVKIWDASGGFLVSRSRVPGGRGLCFSPVEDRLVVGSGTGIDIWDYETGQHTQSSISGWFTTAVWSRTGDTVFCSTEEDGVVAVTGLWRGSEPPRFETIIRPEGRDLRAICLSRDERYLATFWQYPGSVQVWDLSQDPPDLSASYSSRAFCAAFSPGGDRLAWGSGWLMIMDIATNTTISLDPQSRILDLDWPSSEMILSGNERDDGSGEIIVWDARNGSIVSRIQNERGAVWAIASSPACLGCSEDGMVAVLCGPYSLWYYYGGLRVYDSSWDVVYDGAVKGASTFSWPSLSWSPKGQSLAWAHYTGRYLLPGEQSLRTTLLYSTHAWNITQTLDGMGAAWLDEKRLLTILSGGTSHGPLLLWASIPQPQSPLASCAVGFILAIWTGRRRPSPRPKGCLCALFQN